MYVYIYIYIPKSQSKVKYIEIYLPVGGLLLRKIDNMLQEMLFNFPVFQILLTCTC